MTMVPAECTPNKIMAETSERVLSFQNVKILYQAHVLYGRMMFPPCSGNGYRSIIKMD